MLVCLGKIEYDAGSNQFCTNKKRPPFSPHVNAVLPAYGLDRCHSYSFSSMQQCIISILNRFSISYEALSHIFKFANIFYKLGDTESQQQLDQAQKNLYVALYKYRSTLSRQNLDKFLTALNNLLATLNSVTGNLRSARRPYGNSWNRSISKCYDMQQWFYVKNGCAVYDRTGKLLNIDVRQYMDGNPALRSLPSPEDGFCLYNPYDCYLIQALADFNELIGAPSCARVQLLSASDSHGSFLFSSSNCFHRPRFHNAATCPIQIPVRQPDPANPYVWQRLNFG